MLFKELHLKGIRDKTVSLAFRHWKQPKVKEGSLIKTSVGLVKIGAISEVKKEQISVKDARNAGYESKEDLLRSLAPFKGEPGTIYKIKVAYHSEDPRIELRSQTRLTDDAYSELEKKLASLDHHSKHGAWTRKILSAIKAHPRKRAVDLAVLTGFEKEWLKLNIRKLKNLGLTISHEVGYELSPLGMAFVRKK